tara:strand:+ start:12512 stop:13444 length:933 start_codon:yes stop_codon:yes gene_type:complete
MLKIYYWANNIKSNSGEGILALNFLSLLKLKYKNYSFINLNTFNQKENFFYNYILPFFGILKLWIFHIKGNKICYINYLPIWNFLILLLLPKKTILGPITGIDIKNNIIYNILKYLGIFILKRKNNKVLFSHSQFKKYFKNRKEVFYNFILYNFSFRKFSKKKKFDYIVYYKKNKNKGNDFLINIVLRLSEKFKVVVIGDEFQKNLKNKNIFNYQNLNRAKALEIISQSKNSILSKENSLSFFAIDCISCHLNIFHNLDDRLENTINTNTFTPIKFDNLNYSLKILTNKKFLKNNKKYFRFSKENFLDYL